MTGAELAGSCSLLWVPALRSEPLLARGTKVPTTSKDTSDPFFPSISSVLSSELLSLPRTLRPWNSRGGELWGSSFGFNHDYSGKWFDVVMNKGSYFRGDLAAALVGFEEVGEEIKK